MRVGSVGGLGHELLAGGFRVRFFLGVCVCECFGQLWSFRVWLAKYRLPDERAHPPLFRPIVGNINDWPTSWLGGIGLRVSTS